jgi:predicted DNA-binding transcriptional regulator YafY
MEVPDPGIDRLLRSAIKQKRLIQFVYKDKLRIVEPHDYGIHKGELKLLGFQLRGSSTNPLPNWRWMLVNSISDLRMLNETFPGGRPSRKHNEWDEIFIRVEPPETEASDDYVLELQDGEESWTEEERRALHAYIEEGYQQAERGELTDAAQARREIEAMKEKWRERRSPVR